MSIRDRIEASLRQARRDRDEATRNVIAMVKNKVLTELKSGSGREESDELWTDVLTSYAKQLRKAITEFEAVGERGAEAKAEAMFELEFCEGFLPKKLDPAATEALVARVIAEQKLEGPGAIGKLMGALMKDHRESIDGQLAREIGQKLLTQR